MTVAGKLNPNFMQIGTKSTARIGIVPNEVPIPIVIKSPIKSIIAAAIILLPNISGTKALTSSSIPPVEFKTIAKPAATSMTKAT